MRVNAHRKNFALIAVLIVLFALFFWKLITSVPDTDYPVTNLTSGWDATLPDATEQKDVPLTEVAFGVVREGEVYVLRHVLPEDVPGGAMQIKTRHASIEVFVEDELVYAEGMQYPVMRKMTPGQFHFIALPDGYGGKQLTLRIWSNEDGAFSSLEPVIVGNMHDLHTGYMRTGRLTLFASLFLCVMGVLQMFIFFYLTVHYQRENRLFFSGLIAFFLGLYMLSYYNLTDLLSANPLRNDLVEYGTLFYLPFAFVAFLDATQEGGAHQLYVAVRTVNLSVATVILMLHFTGVLYVDRCVTLIHAMIFVEGILLIAIAIRGMIRRRNSGRAAESWKISQKIWVVGFFAMLMSAMIDILRYSFARYSGKGGEAYSNLNIMTMGALAFVATLILNFFYYHIEQMQEEEMMRRLSGLAYTDPLTDMANRARCEQLLREIDEEKMPFTVISMDVNHLKEVNDTYGHAAGDRYLADMAQILTECFREAKLVGRMGGDEFVAIIEGTDEALCRRMLTGLAERVVKANLQKDKPFTYSLSCGFAYSTKTKTGSAKETYQMADARMYDMKKKQHERIAQRA